MVDFFRDEYSFLSNFYPCQIRFDGEEYTSVEHAYQAAKTLDINERKLIQAARLPGRAKHLGSRVTIQPQWDQMKLTVMMNLLRQKFSEVNLRRALLATGDSLLAEGNEWGDRYWGRVQVGDTWEGSNNLGLLLMQLRRELQVDSVERLPKVHLSTWEKVK